MTDTDDCRGERTFHDSWAGSETVADIDVRATFEGCTALEHRFMARRLGNLSGKQILDLGAGLGEAAVYFALHDAKVVAADISLGMLHFSAELATQYGVEIRCVQLLTEALPFPDNSFDIVYVGNCLHHVHNIETTVQDLRRILKPGGIMFSIDPLAYNPVINVYRRMARHMRTPDEHPLTYSDLQTIRRIFPHCELRPFWFLTLSLFLKFYFIDRVHPSEERYWKRIFRVEADVAWWFRPLARLDSCLLRLVPPLRWWCWNIVIVARK